MNPARSLAPAVVLGHLASLWIYLMAPIFGAVLAVLTCRRVQEEGCCASPQNQMGYQPVEVRRDEGAGLQWESRETKPTRQLTLQPVAIEARMEAMKCAKPSV